MARSRSGTRGRRGPRKPPRRDGSGVPSQVQVADPKERGAIDLPATIRSKALGAIAAARTVPQVFVNGRLIGGTEQLKAYLQTAHA